MNFLLLHGWMPVSYTHLDVYKRQGYMRGMELLHIDTVLKDSKTRLQTSGEIAHVDGVLSRLSGLSLIHISCIIHVTGQGIVTKARGGL